MLPAADRRGKAALAGSCSRFPGKLRRSGPGTRAFVRVKPVSELRLGTNGSVRLVPAGPREGVASPIGLRSGPFDVAQGSVERRFSGGLDAGLKPRSTSEATATAKATADPSTSRLRRFAQDDTLEKDGADVGQGLRASG